MNESSPSIPLTVVIFGASGDLTSRKLIPSLYSLYAKGRLPLRTQIVGVSRTILYDHEFRTKMASAVKEFAPKDWNTEIWSSFSKIIFYVAGDAIREGGLSNLSTFLNEREELPKSGDRLYYFSVSPDLYETILERLNSAGFLSSSHSLKKPDGWRRIIIEKPFGKDLASAKKLNSSMLKHLDESQIYRIDHYLAKETVQNLLVFRFANTMFEPLWNHGYIDHVQLTVAESVLVGNRGEYYDKAGIIRDMFQNHLLQVLTVIAMEAPSKYTADLLRNEKVKVLEAITIPTDQEANSQLAFGRYDGYLNEKGVPPDSRTPTFASIKLQIDNWRWRGVPFFLRSGKGMHSRASEIVIQFHCPPHLMFPLPANTSLQCNRLTICIQPDEGIHLNFQTKVPDQEKLVIKPVDMEFTYGKAFSSLPIPESYERLLLDAIQGDASLFMRSDEIERSWAIMDPFIKCYENANGVIPETYPIGSMGPESSAQLLNKNNCEWIPLYANRS